MKICTYCGRECDDDVANCSGCGLDDFLSDVPAPAPDATPDPDADPDSGTEDELVTVSTCQKLADADLVRSKLDAAGIEAFIPDEHLLQNVGFNLNTYGYVRVQVRRQDLDEAKALLADTGEPAETPPPLVIDGKPAIASLPGIVPPELLERLKAASVPFEIQTADDETGLETNHILVQESDYNHGCDVVETWGNDLQEAARQKSPIRCDACGSKNYAQIIHDKLGYIYQCQDCGNEFVG